MKNPLLDEARKLASEVRSWRRTLHAHPELSGHEKNTARFIAAELRKIGLTPVERVGDGYGLTADIRVNDGPMLALRADFDALPIQEETGVEYASTVDGVMHACGHDAHTAMLLGAARLLHRHKQDLKRSVRLVFQPHEELCPGGAQAMIAGGALQSVETIIGLHVSTTQPIGELGTRPGPFMASVNPLSIVITGKGGHAAQPEKCIDPILAAAHVIVALQTVVSRSIPIDQPAVVSVTRVDAGTADNVVPAQAKLEGTIRTFDEEIRTLVCERVREITMRVAEAHQAKATIEIVSGYPVLSNDEDLTRDVLRAARAVGYDEDHLVTLAPQGVGEDFAYYCRQTRGAFVFLGAANQAKGCAYPHHHPRFNIDEDVLPLGVALNAQVALGDAAQSDSR